MKWDLNKLTHSKSDAGFGVRLMSVEQTFFVKAQNGKYLIDGDVAPNLELISGKTYEFNLSDPSLSSHPLEFKLNKDRLEKLGFSPSKFNVSIVPKY